MVPIVIVVIATRNLKVGYSKERGNSSVERTARHREFLVVYEIWEAYFDQFGLFSAIHIHFDGWLDIITFNLVDERK